MPPDGVQPARGQFPPPCGELRRSSEQCVHLSWRCSCVEYQSVSASTVAPAETDAYLRAARASIVRLLSILVPARTFACPSLVPVFNPKFTSKCGQYVLLLG